MNKNIKKGIVFSIIFLFIGVNCSLISGKNLETVKCIININENLISKLRIINDIPPFENPPNEIWNKTYYGEEADVGNYIQQTSDGGYIIVGNFKPFGSMYFDVWLVKTDINGNQLWNKTFGGPYEDLGYCVRETADGGFIIIGKHDSDSKTDIPWYTWIIRTDSNGEILWERKFNRFDGDTYGKSIIDVEDGYLGLAKISFSPGENAIWLIKTDYDGNHLWDKTIGKDNDDYGNAMIQTSDGNIVIVGDTFSFSTHSEVLLIKIDNEGNVLWRKTYDGREGRDIKECDDGGFIIAGKEHVCLIRTDKDGNILWKKEYQWGGFHSALSVEHAFDGGFIVAGNGGFGPVADVIIFKTDKDGNREWERIMGHLEDSDGSRCIIQSNDGTYVLIGTTFSYGSGMWLVKVAPYVNLRPNISSIVGPSHGKWFVEHPFSVSATESENQQLFYYIDWGDNTYIGWKGPFESGDTYEYSHAWFEIGDFVVRIKARDVYGGDSEWESLSIKIPRFFIFKFYYNFLNRFFKIIFV